MTEGEKKPLNRRRYIKLRLAELKAEIADRRERVKESEPGLDRHFAKERLKEMRLERQRLSDERKKLGPAPTAR